MFPMGTMIPDFLVGFPESIEPGHSRVISAVRIA